MLFPGDHQNHACHGRGNLFLDYGRRKEFISNLLIYIQGVLGNQSYPKKMITLESQRS